MSVRKTYLVHKPTDESIKKIEVLERAFSKLHDVIADNCKGGREGVLAMTHLETAAMWAFKGILMADPKSEVIQLADETPCELEKRHAKETAEMTEGHPEWHKPEGHGEVTQAATGETHAIQERSPATSPLGQTPEDREKMGQGVSKPRKAPAPQIQEEDDELEL